MIRLSICCVNCLLGLTLLLPLLQVPLLKFAWDAFGTPLRMFQPSTPGSHPCLRSRNDRQKKMHRRVSCHSLPFFPVTQALKHMKMPESGGIARGEPLGGGTCQTCSSLGYTFSNEENATARYGIPNEKRKMAHHLKTSQQISAASSGCHPQPPQRLRRPGVANPSDPLVLQKD